MKISRTYKNGATLVKSINDMKVVCPDCCNDHFLLVCDGWVGDKENLKNNHFIKCEKCGWRGFSTNLLEKYTYLNLNRTKLIDKIIC